MFSPWCEAGMATLVSSFSNLLSDWVLRAAVGLSLWLRSKYRLTWLSDMVCSLAVWHSRGYMTLPSEVHCQSAGSWGGNPVSHYIIPLALTLRNIGAWEMMIKNFLWLLWYIQTPHVSLITFLGVKKHMLCPKLGNLNYTNIQYLVFAVSRIRKKTTEGISTILVGKMGNGPRKIVGICGHLHRFLKSHLTYKQPFKRLHSYKWWVCGFGHSGCH